MPKLHQHTVLFVSVTILFLALTVVVALLPAHHETQRRDVMPNVQLTEEELEGQQVYIAEGCVACHTQQVRNIDMDMVWGKRGSLPLDYTNATITSALRNPATLMGTERTGPDLTDIGRRIPSEDWHYRHLYDPRSVVPQSIMPSYPWLFTSENGTLRPTQEGRALVAYLLSRKQRDLRDGIAAPETRWKTRTSTTREESAAPTVSGAELYASYCASCHQPNGTGVEGAFPPLIKSPIVLGNNIDTYVSIIMKGIDANPSYAVMPPVGELNGLTAEQVVAIMNHERTSWGHSAPTVSIDDVRRALKKLQSNQRPE